MSQRNGDRARFQKDRKRKMLRRQRIQALSAAAPASSRHGNRRERAAARA